MNTKEKIYKNWSKYLTIFLFGFIILGPGIQSIVPFVSYGDLVREFDEKRELSTLPEFNIEQIDSFPKEFNNYLNDNFEFRTWLIAWNNYVKVKKFKISPDGNVTLGSDDWMFFTTPGVIDNLEGNYLFSKEELELIKTKLEEKTTYVENIDGSFYLVIAPNKSTIYPEYLPYYIDVKSNSRTDQLVSYLRKNSKVKVIEMKDEILAGKETQPQYHHTDSHWNHHGAFNGYQAIIKAIKKDYDQIKQFNSTDFNVTTDTSKGGDIAVILALSGEYSQINYHYSADFDFPGISNFEDSFYKNKDLKDIGIYVKTSNDSTLPKLVFFHDSFSAYQWDFIAYNFSRSVFVWSHEFNKEVIDYEQPKIVLHSIVERDLHLLME